MTSRELCVKKEARATSPAARFDGVGNTNSQRFTIGDLARATQQMVTHAYVVDQSMPHHESCVSDGSGFNRDIEELSFSDGSSDDEVHSVDQHRHGHKKRTVSQKPRNPVVGDHRASSSAHESPFLHTLSRDATATTGDTAKDTLCLDPRCITKSTSCEKGHRRTRNVFQ
jgi:hypothetical protein